MYVDWEGFSDTQKRGVIQRVLDGRSPDFWMDGIGAEKVSEPDQFKRILAGEWEGSVMESSLEHGTYQVWLNRGHPPERFAQAAGEEPYPSFPHRYGHFANVRGNSLDHARELTSDLPSIFSNSFREWEIESGVQTLLPGVIARDIEVGDVIVTPQGKPYRVEKEGFKEIEARELALGQQHKNRGHER